MPDAAREWVQALLRVLLKYRTLVRPGQLAAELVDCVEVDPRAAGACCAIGTPTRFIVVTRAAERAARETAAAARAAAAPATGGARDGRQRDDAGAGTVLALPRDRGRGTARALSCSRARREADGGALSSRPRWRRRRRVEAAALERWARGGSLERQTHKVRRQSLTARCRSTCTVLIAASRTPALDRVRRPAGTVRPAARRQRRRLAANAGPRSRRRAAGAAQKQWLVVADAPLTATAKHRSTGTFPISTGCRARRSRTRRWSKSFIDAPAVLPMKLFTIFTNDARALEHLRRERSRIAGLLKRVGGHHEWGVRVVLDPRVPAAGETAHGRGASAAPGVAYLALKKAQRDAASELAQRARTTVADLYDRLQAQRVGVEAQSGDGAARPGRTVAARCRVPGAALAIGGSSGRWSGVSRKRSPRTATN